MCQGPLRAHDVWELDFRGHDPRSAAVRSLLIPGWGQNFNRQPVKGAAFFLLAGGSLAGGLIMDHKARGTYNDYTTKGLKNDSLYDDYQDQRAQANILLGAAAGVWVWGALDAYLQARVLPPSLAKAAPRTVISVSPLGMASVWRFGGGEE